MGPAPGSREARGFSITTRLDADGACWLELSGDLGRGNVEAFIDALRSAEAEGRPIVIDLSRLEFIDTIGIASLLRAHTRAERERRDLQFRRGPADVQRMLEVVGLDGLILYVD
jgi:anti-sigma B factor antagonist